MSTPLYSKTPITVIGAGAWGTAMATLLAHNGYQVLIWCYEDAVAQAINTHHCNTTYLPSIKLSQSIHATTSIERACKESSIIFQAVPVKAISSVFAQAAPYLDTSHTIINLSKGIEYSSLDLPCDIIKKNIPHNITLATLGGPNFAHDLALQATTATTLATTSTATGHALKKILDNDYFTSFISTDLIGTQIGGAFKNVIAIGAGIAHGAGAYENTRAYLITQGLAEISLLGKALGAQPETMYGLAGLGDLVLCCTGTQSRNFKLGFDLGQNISLQTITTTYAHLPEGINTLTSLEQLRTRYNLTLPLCQNIYKIVFQNALPTTLLQNIA